MGMYGISLRVPPASQSELHFKDNPQQPLYTVCIDSLRIVLGDSDSIFDENESYSLSPQRTAAHTITQKTGASCLEQLNVRIVVFRRLKETAVVELVVPGHVFLRWAGPLFQRCPDV